MHAIFGTCSLELSYFQVNDTYGRLGAASALAASASTQGLRRVRAFTPVVAQLAADRTLEICLGIGGHGDPRPLPPRTQVGFCPRASCEWRTVVSISFTLNVF